MADAISLLLLPFAAAVAFVLIHTWLGVHVLRRRVVFADLGLAQLSALGASVAFAAGHAANGVPAFVYALLFTVLGAALLTGLRVLGRAVNQEAFIGILYVAATAATILIVDRSPQGAEHVRKVFVGSILTVSATDVAELFGLYAAVGVLHAVLRRPLLAASASEPAQGADATARGHWGWDFVFFLSFGLVVTSSVRIAGVLLVFSLLIVPPLIGSFFSPRLPVVLLVGWAVGILASGAGLGGAYWFDLPTGAAMVAALAIALLCGGLVRLLIASKQSGRHRRIAARGSAALALSAILASSLWLIARPAADQPLLALVERTTGIGAADFMSAADRQLYDDAGRDSLRFEVEFARLAAMEKTTRHADAPLTDEEVRRIASYQRSFTDMSRGERFVQDVLRTKARARQRWLIGVPGALLSALGLLLLRRGRAFIPPSQSRLAAMLMLRARMAVLKPNDSTECSSTSRRIG